MNKYVSKRLILAIAGVLSAVIIIYLFAYFVVLKPMKTELNSTNKTIELFESQVSKATTTPNEATNNSDVIINLIPSQPEPEDVLLELENFASTSNTTLNLLESVPLDEETKTEEGTVKKLYLIEATAATLEDANRFLNSFKNSERLFIVDQLIVTKTEQAISIIVNFAVYHQK